MHDELDWHPPWKTSWLQDCAETNDVAANRKEVARIKMEFIFFFWFSIGEQ